MQTTETQTAAQSVTPRDCILSPIQWRDDTLLLLDQRVLPASEVWLECRNPQDVIDAIQKMVVRGAPAIGIAAAYGAVLAYREQASKASVGASEALRTQLDTLAEARPTAVNLAWAVNEARTLMQNYAWDVLGDALLALAKRIHQDDLAANLLMGESGAEVLGQEGDTPFGVLTHCNTGSLATGGYGTALGVIRSAWSKGLIDQVYADETRPWLQGARLTAWELQKDGIPVVLNTDSAAAWLMANDRVRWVIVGADRIAANGDVANKIGTYSLAVLARHHGIRFMVVAPESTVDMSLMSGKGIEIEQRAQEELTSLAGQRIAPENVEVFNPVFDVTPAELIDVIVTDKGCIFDPDINKMQALFGHA